MGCDRLGPGACRRLPVAVPADPALVRTGDLHGSARLARPEDILRSGFLIDDPSAALSQSYALPLGNVRYRGGSDLSVHRAMSMSSSSPLPAPARPRRTSSQPRWTGGAGRSFSTSKGRSRRRRAGHRRQNGSRILLLDPSRNESYAGARYNPLLSIRPYPHDVQDVGELAQLLVPDSPGADPFWKQSARTLLEGVILHVLYAEPEKTLRRLLSLSHPSRSSRSKSGSSACSIPTTIPQEASAGRSTRASRPRPVPFLDMPGQTRGGVVANAQASLSPYADPILEAATATSDFALEDLYRAQRPAGHSLPRRSIPIRFAVWPITSGSSSHRSHRP